MGLFIPLSHYGPENDVSCHNRFGPGLCFVAAARVLVCKTYAASSPFLEGQPHEAFPFLQGDRIHARSTLQGLRRSSHDDDHGITRPVARQQVVDGVLVHRADP